MEADNHKLSERRAGSLAGEIKILSVTTSIETKGFGSTQPITQCSKYLEKTALIRCLAADRRATIESRGLTK